MLSQPVAEPIFVLSIAVPAGYFSTRLGSIGIQGLSETQPP